MTLGCKAGGGAAGKRRECRRLAALGIAIVTVLLAGCVGNLAFGAMLFGDAGVLGLTPYAQMRVAYVLPIVQCALLAPAAALSACWGRRAVLLGGLAVLALGAVAFMVVGIVAVPSLDVAIAGVAGALACVGAAGAVVLTTTSETLLVHRAARGWWGLWVGAYALGLWGGWSVAVSLGAADWLRSELRVIDLWIGGLQLSVMVSAPGWRQAFALLSLAVVLTLFGASVLLPRAAPRRLALDPGLAPWAGSVCALGVLTLLPGNGWVVAGFLLMAGWCLLQHVVGIGNGLVGVGGAPGVVAVTCLAVWLPRCGIAGFQATPLLNELPVWVLLGLIWAAPLLAAVASAARIRDRVAQLSLDDRR